MVIARAPFTADMSAFLPRHPSPNQQVLIEQINDGAASRSLILAIEGEPLTLLASLSQSLATQLRQTNLFDTVQNGQNLQADADQALLFNYRYLLSPANTPERFTASGLKSAVQDSLAEVASSTGLFSKALLTRDPTGESLEVLRRVIPDANINQAEGVWVNAKQTRAMLLGQTKALGADLDGHEQVHAAIDSEFAKVKHQLGAVNARLVYSGPGLFAVQSRETIRSEAARLSTLGILLVLGLLYLIYRSFTALLLGVLPVATGAVAGIAAVALGFPAVHAMTLGFGVTLIGEAVDYAIYLFVQYQGSTQPFAAQFWPTIRLGVLTSIAGFVTLLFSGFTGLAQLGLFTMVGIVVAALVTRFVLPLLLPKSFQVKQPQRLGQLLFGLVQTLRVYKLPALAMIALALGFLALKSNIIWGTQLTDLSPVPSAMQRVDEQLRADLGATEAGALIVIKARDMESALQLSEAASTVLDTLTQTNVLRSYQAPTQFLPSQKTQATRQSNLPDGNTLSTRLTEALSELPLKGDKLGEFLSDIAKAKQLPLLTPKDFTGTTMGVGLQALLNQSAIPNAPQPWTALIALRAPSDTSAGINLTAIKTALTAVNHPAATLHVLDIKSEADAMYSEYFAEAKLLTFIGLALITAVLSLFLRSFRRVLRVLLPLLATVTVVAAGIVWFNGSLSLLHLIGLLLVVAVGSNYALFFDQTDSASVTKAEHFNMLSSLLFANLTTVVGFGLLAFSKVPVMNAIGIAVGPGALLALTLAATFSKPALIKS